MWFLPLRCLHVALSLLLAGARSYSRLRRFAATRIGGRRCRRDGLRSAGEGKGGNGCGGHGKAKVRLGRVGDGRNSRVVGGALLGRSQKAHPRREEATGQRKM